MSYGDNVAKWMARSIDAVIWDAQEWLIISQWVRKVMLIIYVRELSHRKLPVRSDAPGLSRICAT